MICAQSSPATATPLVDVQSNSITIPVDYSQVHHTGILTLFWAINLSLHVCKLGAAWVIVQT